MYNILFLSVIMKFLLIDIMEWNIAYVEKNTYLCKFGFNNNYLPTLLPTHIQNCNIGIAMIHLSGISSRGINCIETHDWFRWASCFLYRNCTAFVCTTFDFPMHLMNLFSWFNNLFVAIYVFCTQVEVIFNDIDFNFILDWTCILH